MLIFDAHLDLALNGVDWNRDLRQSVSDIRSQERFLQMNQLGRGNGTVSFPELQRADVRVGIATLLARQEQPINHAFGRTTPEACYAIASAHLAYYHGMTKSGWMRPITDRQQLTDHLSELANASEKTPFGYLLSMECADAVLDPDAIYEWYDKGLRAIGITHYGVNRYGGGTRSEVGLTIDAIPLLRNIEQLGMVLDLTHLSDVAFWQVAERFSGRMIASHQNARKFCDWQRQFSDRQLGVVIERGGVIGVALDAIMLQPGWVYGETKSEVTLDRVVDNIDHICQLAGNCSHVGIGSDLDGGYGSEQTPCDVDTIADLQLLVERLTNRGYSKSDVQAFMHGNWIRFFQEALPEAENVNKKHDGNADRLKRNGHRVDPRSENAIHFESQLK